MLKIVCRYLLAIFFILAGAMHFVHPEAYLPLMPPIFAQPRLLIAISGAAEILGGLGVLFPTARHWAGWGLIVLLVAVFPANVYMLTARPTILGVQPPPWILWARLPLQGVLILWVWRVTQKQERRFARNLR